MKKKVFSLMMMLLLAFIGVAKAEVVTIGDGTGTTYYGPYNSLWGYSFVEQVYAADEIGTAGTITSISFNMSSTSEQTNSVDVFMKNVSRTSFSANTDWEPVTASDMVFSGTVTFSPGWTTIMLDTPFEYDGSSNLMIGMHEYTPGYSTRYFYYTSVTGALISAHSDSANPNPYDIGSFTGTKYVQNYRLNVQLDITAGGGGASVGDRLHVKYVAGEEEIIDSLNLGVRPIGAWMEPFSFIMYSEGPTYTVNILDFTPDDGLFNVEGQELPFQVRRTQDVDLVMTTNGTQAGLIERQFVAITEGNRAAHVWPVVVELYDPQTPDVWELACEEATTFPFVEVPAMAHHTTLHNDYTLPFPEIPEGYDAVYKLVFDHDQILDAEVIYGEDGKVALYTEDFYGENGPMAHNNYTGIQLGGPVATYPFEAQLGEGTSTSGYFPFYCFYNYSLSQQLYLATELAEAGVSGAPMTSLSWYCTSTNGNLQSNITIWMANVELTAMTAPSMLTAGMTKVYEGNMTPTVGWNEFVFNQGTFAWDGHSNILVSVQRNNGAWASGVNWQVGTQNFTSSLYYYTDSQGAGYGPFDMETTTYNGYTSTSRANVIMKGGNREGGNRDVTVNFEDQQIPADWTNDATYPWTVVSEGGSYRMKSGNGGIASTTSTISATYDLNNPGSISFDALCMGEGTSTIWDKCIFSIDGVQQFSYGANVSGWNNYYYELNPGSHTFTWSYSKDSSVNPTGDYFMVDNVTITGIGDPLPEPEMTYSFGPVIEDLPLRGGTYYLVASSTTPNFEVMINAEDMSCPDVDGYAFNPSPADDAYGIEPNRVTLRWNIPTNATGWRLIFGTTYHPEPDHPQTIMFPEDGSFTTNLANSYTVRNLWNNTNYFWRVEFNNDGCPNGVSSPVWGFTTHLNIPQNLTAVDQTVFDDETIVLNWNAVVDRTYRQYNVYRDDELIGHTQVNNIGNTTYTDGPLAYNLDGYTYYVTAVYDEGESAPSNTVNVKVSGYGNVDGHVYEQDGTTGIAGATVTMVGRDEFNVSHTYNFTTNAQGAYSGHIYAGSYNGQAAKDGYQTIYAPVQGNPIAIDYNNTTSPVDYILDENFDPVCTVIAEYYPDSLDPQSPYVKVYWGCGLPGEEIIEPFETGDFSLFDWQVDPTYPWSITTTNPYEGTYCMKSGGAGVPSVVSNMTVTVNIPADGLMSFFGKISCENNWDYGYFYIDGVQKASFTGAGNWVEKTYDITAGDHTFQWRYTKDSSVDSNDDCFYVDYITFYKRPEPAIPGMTYDFEDGTMQGWTSVDADGDGYGWYMGSEIMTGQPGNNGSNDFVLSQSYYLGTVLYPDNYLVSPQVQLGGIVRFYACAQDASYAAEHFGLAVSTTNTNPSSFTTIQEWTMTAKGGESNGKPVQGSRSGRAQGNWYEYTVDLSAYSGMGYVAIRHFNCSDMFYLNVDDITIGEPGKGMPNNNPRSLSHYRVYRTNCYNDGPYTAENTVLLATVWVPDTVYIDVSWPDAAPGVYKWGVGTVYSGNRGEMIESPISWAEPISVPTQYTAEDYVRMNSLAPQTEQGEINPMPVIPGMTRGNNAYACNAYGGTNPTGWITYDIDNPTAGTSLNSGLTVYGGDLAADGYVYATYNDNTWKKIDPLTGSVEASGNLGMFFVDCAYDYTTNVMYGSYSGTLYTWDLATNTTATVGAMASSMQMIAVDLDGQMYGLAYSTGNFYAIDKTTGSCTLINGSTGYSPAYVQSGGFDHNTGKLYWAGYTTSGLFCEIDKTTGVITQLASNVGEQLSWCVPYSYVPGPTPGGPNLNELALPRESETIWSNCLDKDMWLDVVDVTVLLNSADSPEGVTVTLTNMNEYEQAMYPVAPVTLDETGFYAWDTFRKGDYTVKVEFDGYEPIADTVSIWDETHLRYVMTEILYGVGNIYVSRTGWAMWDDADVPVNPNPGPQPGNNATVILTAGDIWGDGSGYQMLLDADANAYGTTIPETGALSLNCSGNEAIYAEFEYKIPTNADGNCSTQNIVYNNSISIEIPAGTYDWCITNPTPGDRIWIAAANGNVGGRQNDYVFEAGKTYEFTVSMFGSNDGVNVTISGGAKNMNAPMAAGEVKDMANVVPFTPDYTMLPAESENTRHFEYYKVLCTSIDGVPIYNHNTVHPFCQLTTDGPYNAPLVEGEHYLCKVAVMYSTGMSAWSEPVEWEYEPCDHWGPVDEVTVGATNQGNHIEWVFEHGFNPYAGDTPTPPTPGNNATVILTAGDVWGDGSGYQMLLDADANAYGTTIPETGALSLNCSGNEAIYAEFEYKIPTNADGNCSTLNMVMNNSISIEIPAGTYDWCITNPTPGDRIWIASAQGNVGGRQNDYVFEAGMTYEFSVSMQGSNDAVNVVITGGAKNSNAPLACGEVKDIANVTPIKGNAIVKGGDFYTQYAEDGVMLNFYAIDNVDLRAYLLYTISNDSRFSLVPEDEYGQFILTSMTNGNFMAEFETVYQNAVTDFSLLSKVDIANSIANWKNSVSPTNLVSIMMDVMLSKSRVDNDHCINSLPFCTSEVITFEAANTSNTANEPGMDDGCIGYSYNPSFYHMRIHTGGPFVIHMEGHDPNNGTDRDIDFCMWGPYTEQEIQSGTACQNLSSGKIMDCCYSASYSEDCYLGYTEGQHQHNTSHGDINYHMPEVGEYYILMITNYSQQPCVISFTKTEGEGETDCEIVTPTTDVIGFLITQDGEYLAFAGPDDREYTDIDEFGDHEYCVRPIYPGEMVLPDHNYGWSMGCPVCEFGPNGQGTCEPGAPIYGEALNATDQVKIWWGDENPGPGPGTGTTTFGPIDFANGSIPSDWTQIDADGDGNIWEVAASGSTGHGGTGDFCANSKSYDSYALTPDNYLVSPQVDFVSGSTFTFWACAQDAAWASEHFGVAISTSGNTNAADFTTIQEWTMTAKGGKATRDGREMGNWYQYTVNLSSYAGQTGYVAIRHFNCTDWFWLCVDDMQLTDGAKGRANIMKYNVYRSDDNANYTLIGEVAAVAGQTYYEYIDTPASAGAYYYQVRADYGDCESEPAVSGENPGVNYVIVQTTGLNENSDNVALYPNPTNGNVTIEANGMNRITVVSVLGQVVFDTELKADNYTLNMGQFNAGLYLVRVYTENGMTVKRVTVMQ